MADKEKGPGAIGDLKGLFFIIFLIVLAWYLTGGYNRLVSTQGPYLNPPTNIGETGTGYGHLPSLLQGLLPSGSSNSKSTPTQTNTQNDTNIQTSTGPASAVPDILPDKGISIYDAKVYIENTYGAVTSDPRQEYIVIRASSYNTQNVNITGWKIASGATGNNYTLGNGVSLFRSGQVNAEGSIFLKPGESAIITTGRSPVGYSFKTNKCSGYLSQFQSFTPPLSYSCPAPRDADIPLDSYSFNDVCRDYIDRIGICRLPTEIFPVTGGSICQNFITKHFHYNGCVDDHQNDDDFYSTREWRIFLNRDNEIWKSRREIIKLLDTSGNTVDISSY